MTSPSPPPPTLLARSIDISGDGNFTQGCAFSPDGLCVLTATASDRRLRLYNTPLPTPQAAVGAGDGGGGGNRDEAVQREDGGDGNRSSNATMEPIAPNEQATMADRSDCDGGGGGDGGAAPPPSSSPMSSSSSSVLPWRASLTTPPMGDAIQCYAWYPHMNSHHPSTCAFLASSRNQPIHLIDAYTSDIRASYRPYNALDELESANVVTFSPDGERVYASGFRSDRTVHVFRTDVPGRDAADILRLGKTRRSSDGQKGIVSAMAFPPLDDGGGGMLGYGGRGSVFAVGTYSPGSIYIYDDRMPSGGCNGNGSNPAGTVLHGGLCVVGHGRAFARKKRRFAALAVGDSAGGTDADGGDGSDIFSRAKVNWYQSRARGGVTQLTWSPTSDFILYSASRRSDAVLAWDVRMLSGADPTSSLSSGPVRGLASYPRDGDTNQRLGFCFDGSGERLFVSSRDRSVKVYNARTGDVIAGLVIEGLEDVANGVSFVSSGGSSGEGGSLLAVAIGSRRFNECYDDGPIEMHEDARPPGSLLLYKV